MIISLLSRRPRVRVPPRPPRDISFQTDANQHPEPSPGTICVSAGRCAHFAHYSAHHCACALVLACVLACPARAASWKFWRRAGLAASCAASFLDIASTHAAGPAVLEANPLYRGAAGRPAYGRMIGIKIGACVAPIVISEFKSSRKVDIGLAAGGFSAGASYTAVAVHNFRLKEPK